MLTNNMTLKRMIEFEPTPTNMAMLPLDTVLYLKISVVSLEKNDNYDFIRHLFTFDDIDAYFKDINKTTIFDFDGKNTKQERFVTIFENYGLKNYYQTSEFLFEVLNNYNHVADVLIDIFTHDDKKYRISNLDGIVKNEEYH